MKELPAFTRLFLHLFGIVLGVFLGHLFEFFGFFLQLVGNFLLQGMIGLGRLKQAINDLKTVLRIQRRTPRAQNISTDFSRFRLDTGVVDFGLENQFGRFERILRWKVQQQDKFSARVGRIRRTIYMTMPLK